MKQTFSIEDLENVVAPTPLNDVLDSLWMGGVIDNYNLDYRGGFVTIEFNPEVEVKEMFKQMQDGVKPNYKGKGTPQ